MDHSLSKPAASACAWHDVGRNEKQFAVGQDVEISKLTDGGGTLEGKPEAFFLPRSVLGQSIYYRFLSER